MFQALGRVVSRYWPAVIAVWLLGLALGWKLAPSWEAVTETGEISFLPPDSRSLRASELFREAFPLDYSPSSVVLVFYREQETLQEEDKKFISHDVLKALNALAAEDESSINTIRTLGEKGVGALLVSPDRKATLVLIQLDNPFQDPRNVPLIDKIEAQIQQMRFDQVIPAGLEVAVTGSATAGRDLDRAEAASARAIERWTFAVVIVLLLLLYRAPLLALFPLATVFVAVAASLPILTSLAAAGLMSPSRDLRVFITVLAYGAGVDYCVFLIARYREELDHGRPPREALAHAITQVGGAIVASAATVICGIGMLAFAKFGKIQQAGLVIPLALTVTLVGTLTFGAALLRLAGRWAFWPEKVGDNDRRAHAARVADASARKSWFPNLWEKIAPVVIQRPGLVWFSAIIAMAPFVALAIWRYDDTNYNPLGDLPKDAPSAVGTRILAEHFPPGAVSPATVLIKNEQVDFTTDKGIELIDRLTASLLAHKDKLDIADIRTISVPLGTSAAGQEGLAQIGGKKEDVQAVVREEALDYYVSKAKGTAGHVTRLELTLATDPLSSRAIVTLDGIQQELQSALPEALRDSRIEYAGSTASLRDLSEVKRRDQQLIQLLVPAVVFVLLLIVLRRVVVSIYLIVSVLFSYLATLGITYLVFQLIHGHDFVGLDWKVPIFLFTILVAVGEDYNIFLLTRVQEEQETHGPLKAIPIAMVRTGQVISSCGFIMAGTFATLLSGSLLAMQELGFALALGVLLETMVVRPILVPAFLVLLQRWFPGPLGQYLALGKRPAREKSRA